MPYSAGGSSVTYLVEYREEVWLPCLREDLLPEGPSVAVVPAAEFDTPEEAEAFIQRVAGTVTADFRIVRRER